MTHHKSWPKMDLHKPPMTPKKFRPSPPQQVTDHAVIRYLERVMEIDVEQLRHDLLADGRAELIRAIGTGRLHTPHGATLVIVDAKVVSVLRTEEINLGTRVRRSTP